MQLILELILCAPVNAQTVCYHHLEREISETRRDPDVVMREQLDRVVGQAAQYAHSTSWRYEKGRTLLTYLAWVDRQTLTGLATKQLSIASITPPKSAGPLAPRPEKLCIEQVLVHGLKHLRHLMADKKDRWMATNQLDRGTCELLQNLEPAWSGRIGIQPLLSDMAGAG